MNADANVRTWRPMLAALGVHRVSLGAEIARLTECQLAPPLTPGPFHRQIAPRSVRQTEFPALGMDDIVPQELARAKVGPEHAAPALGQTRWRIETVSQRKSQTVPDEAQRAFARTRKHDKLLHRFDSRGK